MLGSHKIPFQKKIPELHNIIILIHGQISGLNALQITQERQSKMIKELKKEITVVRLKGSHYYLRKELPA